MSIEKFISTATEYHYEYIKQTIFIEQQGLVVLKHFNYNTWIHLRPLQK